MKRLLLLVTLILFGTNIAQAAIKVSPASFEIDANKNKKDYISGSFSVAGGKDETVRFKIYPEFFEHDKKGSYVNLADKGQPNSLMGKVKFYPTEFTCKNGLEQKVRFTITGIKNLPAGESRLALFLEDVNTKELLIKKADGAIGGKIIVKTRMGVPIYLNKGNYTRKATLDTVAFKKTEDNYTCEYKINSIGNSRVYYSGFGYVSQGDKLIKKFEVNGTSVDPNKMLEKVQKIDFKNDEIIEGQEYNVKFVLTYKDENNKEKILKKEFKFIPEKPAQKTI